MSKNAKAPDQTYRTLARDTRSGKPWSGASANPLDLGRYANVSSAG